MFLATDTHRLTQTTILFSPVDLTEENQSALWAIIIELNSKS